MRDEPVDEEREQPDADELPDDVWDDEAQEESWDNVGDAPIDADPLESFICKPCGGDDEVQDDEGNGFQLPKGLPEPKPPSVEAQRRHNLTHWPCASWCPHCMMGAQNNTPHVQARGGADRSLPLLVLDYCFIRNASDQDLVTLFVGKLYPYKRAFACVIDLKGTKDTYAIGRLSEFIRGSGPNNCVYKTDQESSDRAAAEESVKYAQAKDEQIKGVVEEAASQRCSAGVQRCGRICFQWQGRQCRANG